MSSTPKPTDELVWIRVGEQTSPYSCLIMTEYIDSTNTFGKQVWSDGYEEIFELAEKPTQKDS